MPQIVIYSRDPVVGAWIPNTTKRTLRDAKKHRDALVEHGYDVRVLYEGREVFDSTDSGPDLDA